MRFDPEIAAFMTSPVMIITGTCSDARVPEIGRAVGAMVDAEEGWVDLLISAWQWPGTVTNIRQNGRLAVTFARPADYVSYQVKGRAGAIPVDERHLVRSRWYVGATAEVLTALGVAPALAAEWLIERDPTAFRLHADAIFWQTPGAKAGQRLGELG